MNAETFPAASPRKLAGEPAAFNLTHWLAEHAAARPAAIALVEGSGPRTRSVTFAELARRVETGAAWLRAQGLHRGDAVLLFAPISIALYEVLLSLWHGGMTAVVVDPAMGRSGLELCCRRLPPAGFVAAPQAHWLRLVSPALRRVRPAIALGGWAPLARRWPSQPEGETMHHAEMVPPETPALVTFTSGSTGEPKASVRTHDLLAAQYRALRPNLAFAPGHVELATLPILALASLAAGVTTVLAEANLRHPGAIDPGPVLRQMREHGVTRCTAAPAFLERLLDAEEARGRTCDHLTHIFTGGGPVFPRLLARLQNWAPRAFVGEVYGSTEAEPIAHLPASELSADDRRRMRQGQGVPAGRPVAQIALEIIANRPETSLGRLTPAEFAALRVPAGQPGEIVVAGAHVLPGYLDGNGDAESKFTVAGTRWHRTGDAGCRDALGRLWLLGRCAARIRDDRGELYPFAVEGVAAEASGVQRTALAAVKGRRVLAIELAPDAERGCVDELARALAWAQLDEIRVLRKLPMDRRHNSKVDYTRLMRALQAG